MRRTEPLRYRPALDGLRGVAVAAIVLYHLKPEALSGGWLGVDLFFVLSGFLITSLLLHQMRRQGRIDVRTFWLGRMRRLLPSLLVMLSAVVLASIFLAASGRRPAIALQALAALFYVSNWLFVATDEHYFASVGMPSPLRHTWSLSIEEQFYLLFPLVLIALLFVVRRRATLAAGITVIAAASAGWAAAKYVPGLDPSRVYYGTDSRIYELLIGAAAGAFFGAHCFVGRSTWRLDAPLARMAWPAAAVLLAGFIFVDEQSSMVFRGGLVLFCIVAVVPIVVSAGREPTAFQRALGWEPLRRLGLISYSLYVWHWPVIVFLNASVVPNPWLRPAAQLALSVGLAYATWRWVEQPIRTGGVRALIPARPTLGWVAMGSAAALVVVGPFVVSSVPAPASEQRSAQLPIGAYVPMEVRANVSVLGNSIPESLLVGFDPAEYPDFRVQKVTSIGCDPFAAVPWRNQAATSPPAECRGWKEGGWVEDLRTQKPSATIFFIPQTTTGDWSSQGRHVAFGTPAYDTWLTGELTRLQRMVKTTTGGKFVLANLSCHRQVDFGLDATIRHVNDDQRVRHVNGVVASWARTSGVTVIDQFEALCRDGYHDAVNGVPLYKDTLHFTPESSRIMWGWLVPQLQPLLRSRA